MRKVMGFGLITSYAWLLPTYASDVGCGPGRFKRTEPHEGVIGTLARRRLHSRAIGVMLRPEFNN